MDVGVINFEVYEDSVNYLGTASVTLPTLNSLVQSISGAGIAGTIEVPVHGHIDAMTATFNFRTTTHHSAKLSEPRAHQLECRAAIQDASATTRELAVNSLKVIMIAHPKSHTLGSLAPASSADTSVEVDVTYLSIYLNGAKITEVDPINYIYTVNGTDYLADVRNALGK